MIEKPPLPAAINYGHPLAKGIIACFLCNELGGPMVDLVSNNKVPLVASGVRSIGRMGNTLDCIGSDSGARTTAWDLLKVVTSEVTILWRGTVGSSPSAFAGLFGVSHSTGSPFSCFQFDLGSTGALIRMVWNSGGVQNNLSATPNLSYDGTTERQYVGVVRGSSGLCELWENYIRLNSTTANFGPTYNAASGMEIGTLRSGAALNSKSVFRHGYIWRRALVASEVAWLYNEPYAFIQSARKHLFVLPTASTVKFRRSLSDLGTRTGSRQMVS